jgi:Bacterial capsule synthesis protein PGA_cap
MNLSLKKLGLFEKGFCDFEAYDESHDYLTVTAGGDTALTREPGEKFAEIGAENFWKSLKPLIQADISMCNLEVGLFSKPTSIKGGVKGEMETFIKSHKEMPFSLYGMANNHIRDAGVEELMKTFELFESNDINYIGAGKDIEEAVKPFYKTCKGVKIGVLAFAQDEEQIADKNTPGSAPLDPEIIIPCVKKLVDSCDIPIVHLHEGFEFLNWPRPAFKDFCHELVKMGVKVIFAHHSHVPQGIEVLNDSLIFYSLGNFVFYTPRFEVYPWSLCSFIPKIYFKGKKIARLELQALVIHPDQGAITLPANAKDTEKILTHLEEVSEDVLDNKKLLKGVDSFLVDILLKEYFGFICRYGTEHNGDYTGLIEMIKKSEPQKKIFKDMAMVYPPLL